MIWILPIISTVLSAIYSYFEIKYDKKIVDALATKNPKLTQNLIHGMQMPFRAAAYVAITVVCAVVAVILGEASTKNIMLGIILNSAVNIWISIDLFAAVWWLKKPWWYIGETDELVDKRLNNPVVNWSIKVLLLVASLILIFK